jgi:protein-disulfide isomerase
MDKWANRLALACLSAVATLGAPASAPADQPQVPADQVERIVRDYLLREPEIVYEALQELQRRQAEAAQARQRAAIVENQAELLEAPHTPIGGNPDGDVTLVEFFDYRCAYCRRVVSSMQALLGEDRNLRVVFKDLPVLGPDSVRAARAALASRRQNGYVPFHFALMTTDDLSMPGIRAVAESVGLDPDRLERDMASAEVSAAIDANYQLANELGIEGTPAFVIGEQLIPGAVDKARLEQLIREARQG